MDPPEPKSQLNDNNNNNQQHHPDSLLHSDPSIDIDKIAQAIAKDLETLVLSCKHDQLQHTYNHSVVIHDDENQLKQQADDEAVEAESWSEIEEVERRRLEKVLEADLKEFRVLEERGTVESEIGCEKDGDLSSEIGDYENNNNNSNNNNNNNNVEYEGVQHLENNNVEYEGVQHLENEIGGDGWEEGSRAVRDDGKSNSYHYPLRLDAEDCAYYIRTGMCKFGSNCKFNHPLRRRNQQPAKETKKQKEENVEKRGQTECKPTKEMNRQKEENIEKRWQTECKYHASTAGCKYGKACKFNHGRGKTVKTPVVEYNFLGLPIRPGERECPYYMRNGSCKYGPSCRFNHPDPTAVGGDDAPTTYGNDEPLPLQLTPQSNIPNMPSWSAPITPDPPASFVSVMYPPTQNMPPPNPEWNGYQAPAPVPAHLYPSSEQGLPIPPAFFLKNPPSNTNVYTHQQQPMSVSEYPERPGQPDCSYFMKTGVCKYRASCKFHHPQSRISRTSRDQNICAYFSRHGTCKYGKACKYDHPENYHSNSNPAEGYDGSNGPRPLVHQSV